MIVLLKENPNAVAVANLKQWLNNEGITVHVSEGERHTILGLVGDTSRLDMSLIQALEIVDDVKRIQEPFKNANRKFHPQDTVIEVSGPGLETARIGGEHFAVIAGPCSVETESQICQVAEAVKKAGATMLRGGAFKPRTSPYAFQGLGAEGIRLLKLAREHTGLPIVTEVMDADQLPLFEDVDVIQVGARNMQNFELLKKLGRMDKPVLLKRGMSATLEELLMSAEYIMAGGNEKVILCERGIRTFETKTRNTLDLSAVPVLKNLSHLPVVVDPSHATGVSKLVAPMSLAATAAGADGLIIEVHNDPERALCDGPQSLRPEAFAELAEKVRGVRAAIRAMA